MDYPDDLPILEAIKRKFPGKDTKWQSWAEIFESEDVETVGDVRVLTDEVWAGLKLTGLVRSALADLRAPGGGGAVPPKKEESKAEVAAVAPKPVAARPNPTPAAKPTVNTKAPVAAGGGGAGKCGSCACTNFTADPFKPTKCSNCFHVHTEGNAATPRPSVTVDAQKVERERLEKERLEKEKRDRQPTTTTRAPASSPAPQAKPSAPAKVNSNGKPGQCPECDCTHFTPDAFRKTKCAQCFHNHPPGDGEHAESSAAAAPTPSPGPATRGRGGGVASRGGGAAARPTVVDPPAQEDEPERPAPVASVRGRGGGVAVRGRGGHVAAPRAPEPAEDTSNGDGADDSTPAAAPVRAPTGPAVRGRGGGAVRGRGGMVGGGSVPPSAPEPPKPAEDDSNDFEAEERAEAAKREQAEQREREENEKREKAQAEKERIEREKNEKDRVQKEKAEKEKRERAEKEQREKEKREREQREKEQAAAAAAAAATASAGGDSEARQTWGDWEEMWDEGNQCFYYDNLVTGVTSWDKPDGWPHGDVPPPSLALEPAQPPSPVQSGGGKDLGVCECGVPYHSELVAFCTECGVPKKAKEEAPAAVVASPQAPAKPKAPAKPQQNEPAKFTPKLPVAPVRKQEEPAPAESTQKVFCSECGTPFEGPQEKFCSECGSPQPAPVKAKAPIGKVQLPSAPKSPEPGPRPPPNKKIPVSPSTLSSLEGTLAAGLGNQSKNLDLSRVGDWQPKEFASTPSRPAGNQSAGASTEGNSQNPEGKMTAIHSTLKSSIANTKKSGMLNKCPAAKKGDILRSGWKPRYFALQADTRFLSYWAGGGAYGAPTGTINLRQAECTITDKAPMAFRLVENGKKYFYIQASTNESRDDWIASINAVINPPAR